MNAVAHTARLFGAVRNAWQARWLFLVLFFLVFFVSFSALLSLGLVPDGNGNGTTDTSPAVTLVASPLVASANASALSPNVADAFRAGLSTEAGEQPVKVEIPSIGLSVSVANPATTNVETLDQYLLRGAVRYPTSGLLGENGNVILFGHSSYLPIVNNPAYKTFDGIQKLAADDQITVYSSDRAYVYSVDTVQKESADSAAIPLTTTGQELTLSTCDSFGEKTDRFVVTAHLVSSSAL